MASGRYHRSSSFGVSDDLESYLAEVRQYPLLDRDKERILGARMQRSLKKLLSAFRTLPARERQRLLVASGIAKFRRGTPIHMLSNLCSNVSQYALQTGKKKILKTAAMMTAEFDRYEAAHLMFVVSNLRFVRSSTRRLACSSGT